MASITVDIQAKVVGYEASLKAMKDAFSKIDPGSDIGKSLEKAIKYAEGQLKNLNKNLTPKASSDTQIDSIVEKTNRAGEAIQEVTRLMQKVNIGDIDFSSFENGIGKLMGTLRDLETELDSRVSKGLRETIANSSELTESFSKLNIDTKDKSAGEIFEIVAEKAKKAAEETETAQSKLDAAQKNLNSQQGKLNQLESNPIYNKSALEQDLQNIAVEYTKTFDEIKIKIQEGLNGLLGNDSVKADKLMENFMSGLNPQTLKDHLMQLKNELQQELTQNNSAKDIYRALLGDEGAGGNAQAITTKLLSGLNQSLPQVKEELQNKVQEFISSLTNKEAGQITTLINLGDIENAVKTTIQAIERAYDSVKGAAAKQRAEVLRAMEGKETAQTGFNTAQQNQQDIESLRASLQDQINKLLDENNTLRADIAKLRSEIDEKKNAETTKIRQSAAESNTKTNNLKIAAEEAKMYRTELQQVQAKEKLIGKVEGVVQRWFSIYAAVRMVGNAIRSVISTVKELDKTITEIAIVTDMTQNELWGQMKSYTDMARQYAASISGVYKVSQLYYQQGLQTADVMALTEETLKMARISGLDYAEATDYMTNAIRSFKMEMTDAQVVVDVYSSIAASSATSTSELANAMSKTASSAAAVGSSFENTTAMMAVMIEATRESAENIGSAMKSIISRYGEMKADPSKLVDSEGQEMSLNKVDKALQSVGISIQDTNHQFRDFDDVITELAGKWDTIDTNTQRYIATVMAGNRQQSRFLALVSNGERLAELSEKAANSEDTATLQVLKTMDSIEAKTQQFKTSLQSLYTDAGIEKLYKNVLDFGNNIVQTFTNFSKAMGTPLAAVTKFGVQFASLANIVTTVFGLIKARLIMQTKALQGEMTAETMRGTTERIEINYEEVIAITKEYEQGIINYETYQNRLNQLATEGVNTRTNIQQGEFSNTRGGITKSTAKWGMALNLAGSMASLAASQISEKTQPERTGKAWLTGFGATAQGAGLGSMFGLKGMAIGAVLGTISGAIEAIGIATESTEEKIKNLNDTIEETGNKKIQSKDDLKTLIDYKKKYEELAKTRNQDAESREEWIKLNNEIAAKYPELIKNMDMEGNYIIDMTTAYQQLAEAKLGAYKSDFLSNMSAELQGLNDIDYVLSKIYNANPIENNWNLIGKAFSTSQSVGQDSTNQFINYLLGLSEKMPSMTVDTIEHLFGSKTQGLISSSYLQGFGGLPGKYFESINEKYEGASEQLLQQFYDLSQAGLSLEEAKTELKQQYNDSTLLAAIDGFNSDVYNYLLSAGKAIEFQDTLVQNKINQGNQEWLNIISQMYDLGPSSIQNALALQELNSAWEEYYSSNASRLGEVEVDEDGINYHTVDAGVLYQEFINQYEGQWLNQFIDDNKQFADEALNELYDQAGRYNRSTYIPKLKSMNIADEDLDKLIALYDKAYAEAVEQFRESVTSHFEKGTFEYARAVELSEIIPPDFFDTVNEKIQQIYDNDLLTDDIKTEQFNAFSKVIRFIDQLPELQKTTAYGALEHADLTSLTGIYDFLDSLENAGLDLDGTELKTAILDFGSTLSLNLATEFNTFAQSIISKSEDFEKALSKAEKGMDLKEASEMAEKLKINVSDFNYRNGKFFIDDATKIYDAYIQYNTDLETALDDEVTNLTNAIKNYDLDTIFKDTSDLITSQWFDGDLEDAFNFVLNAKGIEHSPENIEQLAKFYRSYYEAAEAANMSVEEYIDEQIAQGNEDLAVIREAINYNTNAALIHGGQIGTFLGNVMGDTWSEMGRWGSQQKVIDTIMSGDFSNLDERITPYISELWSYVQNAQKDVFDKAIASVKGGKQLIEKNSKNAAFLEKYGQEAEDGIHYWLDLTAENLGGLQQDILTAVESGAITEEEGKDFLNKIHDINYEDNIYDAFSSIVDSFDSFSYEAGQKLALALKKDLSDVDTMFSTDAAGNLTASYDNLIEWLNTSSLDKTSKQYNDLRAKLEAHQRELSNDEILTNIIQNRNKLNEENVAALANLLEKSYDYVIDWMVRSNTDGTYSLNLNTLIVQLQNKEIELSEAVTDLIAGQIDTIISSVTGLAGSQSKGFTDLGSMQKYVTSLRDKNISINGEDASLQNLFEYNESLRAYQLTTAGIIANIKSNKGEIDWLRLQLEQTSDTESRARLQEQIDVAQTFIENSVKEFADAIDLSSFLDADFGSAAAVQAEVKIKKAVEDYNSALLAMGETAGINADKLINALKAGGEVAVKAMEQVAEKQGKTLSASDVESAYRGQISKWVDAIDTIVAKPGEIVDVATAGIIGTSGGIVNELGDTGQFVVESAANLYEAYNNLLRQMAATGEATLADLNKVAALALENRDGEQQVIDALGDAAGMTFTRFGEILANAGIQLTEDMVNNLEAAGIIDLMGGNKMKIVDFQAFADLMHWDANSEEYISAFKTYNDSLIEMNRQAERNILEEAQNVAGAKGGDWVNLTQLMSKLQESFRYVGSEKISLGDSLATSIQKFGAKIEDGILKLDDSANIPAIIQEIAQAAAESGGLLSNELAELADAVADAIKGYADLISGAISGSLSNTQAEQLQDWASTNGIGKLNFTKTADGLKVATDQAFELVGALQQVDSIQGKLTFDNLVDSLSADKGGKFENISKTTAEIAKLQDQINKNQKDIELAKHYGADSDNEQVKALESQNEKLREQLNLYAQIQQRQSLDPSQYNFMDRDLPEQMQSPINYWNSVGKAFSAMNESSKTGMMEIQDFYNIVNEMENLANISGTVFDFAGYSIGGEASQAADLIQNGMSALTNIDGKGVKVNLQNLGIDFADGANGAKNDFHKGVQALAKSQVEMLDAAIRVLEVVVAMEKLGNIDVDNNNIFSIGDLFKMDDAGNFEKNEEGLTKYTDEFSQYANDLLEASKTNEDLRKGLETFSINGITLKEMFEDAKDGIKKLNISEEAYFAVMEAFVNAAKNGDYNLDTIQDSVWEILDQTLPDGSVIDVGDRSIIISGGTHTVINWDDEKTKKALEEFKGTEKEKKDALIAAFTAYANGTSDTVQFKSVLIAKGLIEVDTEGNVVIDGKSYSPDSVEALNAIAQAALKDLGVSESDMQSTIDSDAGTVEVRGTKKIGDIPVTIISDGSKVHYEYNGISYDTIDDLRDDLVKKALEEKLKENPDVVEGSEEYLELEAEAKAEVNVKLGKIEHKAEFSGLPNKINNILNLTEKEIQDIIDKAERGEDGKWHFTSEPTGDITFSDKNLSAEEFKQSAIDQLDPDGLIAKIATGIKTAFTDKDNTIGTAIGEGVRSALKNWNASDTDIPTIPSIDAKVGEVHITDVGSASMGGSGLVNKIVSFFGGTKAVTIDSMDGQLTNLKITGVTNPVDFSQVTADAESESLTIKNLTATATTLDVANVGETVLGTEASVEVPVTADTADAEDSIQALDDSINNPQSKPVTVSDTAQKAIDKLDASILMPKPKPVKVNVTLPKVWDDLGKPINKTVKVHAAKAGYWPEGAWVKGTVALAKGNTQGPAKAAGSTLMGELGPELVVSKGKYFLVGEFGPEMVHLDPDAVVFNHLQTRDLLGKGKTTTYGKAVTNERTAVSMVTGNTSGPAMASASAALAQLKQLREMWRSLASASLQNMGGMGGGSGGGGGGGGGGDTDKVVEGITANVERWYNWLQLIDKTQDHLNILTHSNQF